MLDVFKLKVNKNMLWSTLLIPLFSSWLSLTGQTQGYDGRI
jgi:hypothetical protein